MIRAGVESGQRVVERERHPRQRLVVPQERGGPHPSELVRPGKVEVRVVDQQPVIVVVHEAVRKRREKRGDRGKSGQGETDRHPRAGGARMFGRGSSGRHDAHDSSPRIHTLEVNLDPNDRIAWIQIGGDPIRHGGKP